MDQEETQLIERSKCGDESAYRELIERYQQAIHRFCFGILRDTGEAEDVTQETFIAAYQKLHSYDPKYKFSTWLFVIARRRSFNVIRRAKRFVLLGNDSHVDVRLDEHLPADILDVRRAVENLPTRYREPVEMFYWMGLSQNEIAQILGITTGAVKTRLTRAKDELRKELV